MNINMESLFLITTKASGSFYVIANGYDEAVEGVNNLLERTNYGRTVIDIKKLSERMELSSIDKSKPNLYIPEKRLFFREDLFPGDKNKEK